MRASYYCIVLVTAVVSSISGLSLDCAVNRTTGAPLATAVEGCVCPQGYKVKIFFASFHRQISADIKIRNYKIKTSFIIGANQKTGDNTRCMKLMIFFLINVENCL